jgi:hypothetical protein
MDETAIGYKFCNYYLRTEDKSLGNCNSDFARLSDIEYVILLRLIENSIKGSEEFVEFENFFASEEFKESEIFKQRKENENETKWNSTDITQAVRSLRKRFFDSSSNPTFIETNPVRNSKSYRFIASVEIDTDFSLPTNPSQNVSPPKDAKEDEDEKDSFKLWLKSSGKTVKTVFITLVSLSVLGSAGLLVHYIKAPILDSNIIEEKTVSLKNQKTSINQQLNDQTNLIKVIPKTQDFKEITGKSQEIQKNLEKLNTEIDDKQKGIDKDKELLKSVSIYSQIAMLTGSIFHVFLLIYAFKYHRKHDKIEGFEENIRFEDIKASTNFKDDEKWKDGSKKAIHALRQFRGNFGNLLRKWCFLYLISTILYLIKISIETSWIVDNNFKGFIEYSSPIIITYFNLLSTLAIFLCYNTLSKQISTEDKRSGNQIVIAENPIDKELESDYSNYIIYYLIFGVVVMIISYSFGWSPQKFENIYMGVGGICGGLSMALFVGCLQSKFLRSPGWMIPVLYFYTVIQGFFIFFTGDTPDDKAAGAIIINIALILKCILILYMLWLLQSGRLLFYLVHVRRDSKEAESDWKIFRKFLKYK